MKTVKEGDKVVSIAADGQSVEVHSVFKILGDEIQFQDASGRISKSGVRCYDESIIDQIQAKEKELKDLKQEIRALYDKLDHVG